MGLLWNMGPLALASRNLFKFDRNFKLRKILSMYMEVSH